MPLNFQKLYFFTKSIKDFSFKTSIKKNNGLISYNTET